MITAYELHPAGEFHVDRYVDQVRLVSFLALGTLISLLSERARRLQVRAAVNELALAESRYLTLIYQSSDPIMVLKNGIIRVLNTPMVFLLGPIRRQGLLNEPILDFIHPDDKELAQIWIAEARAGMSRAPARLRFVRLDGQIIEANALLEVSESAEGRSVQMTLSEARSIVNSATDVALGGKPAEPVAGQPGL